MTQALYAVVAYDIQDTARRVRIARILEAYGQRVQYSVFECELDERRLKRLVEMLRRELEPGDAVRVYRMPKGRADVLILGGRGMVQSPSVIII